MHNMKVSIILPVRNEEMLIRKCLLEISNYLNKKKYRYEIITVLNGSTDESENLIKLISNKNKNIKVVYSKPGYGIALKKGLSKSIGKYVVIFNVDFYDLHILDLIDIDLYGRDLVMGSKMANWSEDKRPFNRRLVSYIYNIFLKILFKFKGTDTHGIKVMKKEVIDRVLKKCKTTGGIMDTEFVIRSQRENFKISDFPVILEEKRPPRFVNRFLSTPLDIYNLKKALQ